MRSKKGQTIWILYTLGTVIAFFGLFWIYYQLSAVEECSGLNPSCAENQYCSVDFKCHDFPNLEKITLQKETIKSYKIAAGVWFVLISLVVAYLILRRKKNER